MGALRRRWSGLAAADKVVWAMLVAAAVLAAAYIASLSGEPDPGPRVAKSRPANPTVSSAASTVDTTRPTSTAAEGRPLVMKTTDVRLVSTDLSATTVSMRMRIRNRTDVEQVVEPGGTQVTLVVGNQRYRSETGQPVPVPPQEATTFSLEFDLGREGVQRLGFLKKGELRVDAFGGTQETGALAFSPISE